MGFFKRELSPVERFESALREKQAGRQKLADRLSLAEGLLAEKRAAAERLAVAGAANARLERAEADMRSVEDRVKTLRAALAEFDEQVASTERALADAIAQRDRNLAADGIEAMAAAIERAIPGFDAGTAALVGAVTTSDAPMPEAARFSSSVDAIRQEILAAADLICWELRSAAVRTRAGNANVALLAAPEPEQPPSAEIERQLIYTLNPLLVAGGRRGAPGSGVRAGGAAESLAAGGAAGSPCGPSERPAGADADARPWQRAGGQRNLSRRSAAHRSRCARRGRNRERPGRGGLRNARRVIVPEQFIHTS